VSTTAAAAQDGVDNDFAVRGRFRESLGANWSGPAADDRSIPARRRGPAAGRTLDSQCPYVSIADAAAAAAALTAFTNFIVTRRVIARNTTGLGISLRVVITYIRNYYY